MLGLTRAQIRAYLFLELMTRFAEKDEKVEFITKSFQNMGLYRMPSKIFMGHAGHGLCYCELDGLRFALV